MTESVTFLELRLACGFTPRGLWAGDLHAGSTGRADQSLGVGKLSDEADGTALAGFQTETGGG